MNRRELLKTSVMSAATLMMLPRIARSNECAAKLTPAQVEGPFYPVVDQVDVDADLILLKGASQIAEGEIVIVEGVVTNQNCEPVGNALVEIWQACKSGRYNHPSDPNTATLDPNFQYWGKAVTNAQGFYRFRTIIPGAYPADTGWMRPPHIHFKVSKKGYLELITQMYFAGQNLNAKDLILKRLPLHDQKKVIVDFKTEKDIPHPVGIFNIAIEKL